MKTIKGIFKTREVFIDDKPLSPVSSQKLRNHSPDGFGWGYSGSGPAQLSLALLFHFTRDEKFSLSHYHDFKNEIVANLKPDFVLPVADIEKWIFNKTCKENI